MMDLPHFYCFVVFLTIIEIGHASEAISSKLAFSEEGVEFRRKPRLFYEIKDLKSSESSPCSEQQTSEIFSSDGSKEPLEMREKVVQPSNPNIQCDGGKCVVTFAQKNSDKKISTDVHVKVSTSFDNEPEEAVADDEDEVPVIKGYVGVRPEDINHDDDIKDPKTYNKIPSVIPNIIHIDNPNIAKPEEPEFQKPSIYLKPPGYKPENWHHYSNWKNKPQQYHPYSIGQINGGNSESNEVHPLIKPQLYPDPNSWNTKNPSSNNQYHYTRNDDEHSGFTTYCSCVRKPVNIPRPRVPPVYRPPLVPTRPSYPWYPTPETTTKVNLDDKLLPPFSQNKNTTMKY